MRVFNALAVLVELRDEEVCAVVLGCITEGERKRGWKVRSARWSQHRSPVAGSDGWGFDRMYIETGGGLLKSGKSTTGRAHFMRTAERVVL